LDQGNTSGKSQTHHRNTRDSLICAPVLSQTSPQITPEPSVGKGIVVLKAARLIDGAGAAAVNDAVVVITDNTITAVGPASSVIVPPNARVIDLGDVTLRPGFFDAHTHLVGRVLGDPAGDNAAARDSNPLLRFRAWNTRARL